MGFSNTVGLSTTLNPLPLEVHRGLIAVAAFGILSLSASLGLFLFLSFRLFTWHRKDQLRDGVNQFFVLVYNLLIADIHQALAFALTLVYVAENKIEVGTSICFAQAWFVSTGDLASGVFILILALHTFFAIVKGQVCKSRTFYTFIAAAWTFVYAMAIATVSIDGHIFVRAGAWCWIDKKYEKERLVLHYIWIFVAMVGVIVIYTLIYLFITSEACQQARRSTETQCNTSVTETETQPTSTRRAAKYMIIYPIVYVFCTLPLAGGRMAAMTGFVVPYWYYCLAGAAITSCGWLDVLLYGIIRRVVIFSHSPPSKADLRLNTFGWHYDHEFYRTITTIEGPLTRQRSTISRWSRKGAPSVQDDELALNRLHMTLRESVGKDSNERYFTQPTEGVITTKTTVEVVTGQMLGYSSSEASVRDGAGKHHPQVPRLPKI